MRCLTAPKLAAGSSSKGQRPHREHAQQCVTQTSTVQQHSKRQEQQQQEQQQQQQRQQAQQCGLCSAAAGLRFAVAGAAAVTLCCTSPVQAATADANFGTKCLGCHTNGGNIIQAGATLVQADLVKNGLSDSESLYKLIYSGKGRMPGFGQDCAPKLQCTFGPRLSDAEVQDLVQYVQDQAAAGWK